MRDLHEQLTAFVITVGDQPNVRECLQCLRTQSIHFRLEVISNVAPMSRAFTEMHRRCETPTFVQVDEDMLLSSSALERLYVELEKAATTTAIIVAPLWDVQVERPVYGLKMARTEVVTRFPFRDLMSCEVHHNRDLVAAGFDVVSLPLEWDRDACFGVHGKHYTPETAFLRWKRMFQKQRRTGRPLWVAPWPARFLARYRRTGSAIDLYSFLGAVSALSGELPADREHDYRETCDDFERIREALERDRLGRERVREVGEAARSSVSRWRTRFREWLRRRGSKG